MNQGKDKGFGNGVDRFCEKTRTRLDRLLRAVGIECFSGTITATPVGDPDLWKAAVPPPGYVGGRLRANWNCSLGHPDLSTVEDDDEEQYNVNFRTGAETHAAMHATMATANRTSTLWLSNSLPYADPIEYDSHSSQAPAGMARINVSRVKLLLPELIRNVKTSS